MKKLLLLLSLSFLINFNVMSEENEGYVDAERFVELLSSTSYNSNIEDLKKVKIEVNEIMSVFEFESVEYKVDFLKRFFDKGREIINSSSEVTLLNQVLEEFIQKQKR